MLVFIGDIHGEFGNLNSLINRIIQKNQDKEIDFIQCGDFGIWPPENFKELEKIKTHGRNLYFVPGNHENWNEIDRYSLGEAHEIFPNIHMCTFGAKLEIQNKKILFVGGAYSIDKHYRIEGESWWRQEIITNKDMDFLFDNVKTEKIDIVVSHTCPTYFYQKLKVPYHNLKKFHDPSCQALDIIFDKFNPDNWFFGHFHIHDYNMYRNCYWECLNHISSQGTFYKKFGE